ncbi:unnamed protein product, partial [Closterium sp. NIES-53]
LCEWFAKRGASEGSVPCPYVIRTGDRAGHTCGNFHTQHCCFSRLDDAWRAVFGDKSERPRWLELLRFGVDIFALDYDAILAAMYALSVTAEGDCYLCVPPDPGIDAAALGASESALPSIAPAQALHTFTLDSVASRYFFRDNTTLTPLPAPVLVRLGDPSGGPVLAHSSTVLSCPAVLFSSLSGLYFPPFSTNLVSVSGPVAAPCTCRLLSHQTLLWHHHLGHSSLPRLRGMHSCFLVSGLPRSLPPLPPSPALPCLPSVEGRQRAAPHSSSPPTNAHLQTLHMDVWVPACVSGQDHEHYFLLVVDDYTRYTTVFPMRSKGKVPDLLIPWICAVRLQLRERFREDLHVLRLHSNRGGEFSSDLLRDFCCGEGILHSFTLPASPQQNGVAERRIGLVMLVACTSMIQAAAPHFLWPFVVRYAAHQLNLWPRVSLPETLPTLRWTGKVGDASVFRVWGSRAFVRDTSADKLSSRAIPCVLLGFPPDAPGWQFYHPTLRRVLSSHDVTDAGAGGTGAGDPGAREVGAGGAGVGGTGVGGTVQRRPLFVSPPPSSLPPPDSVLRQVLSLPSSTGLTPSLLCPPPHQTQPQLQLDSALPSPPYAEQTESLRERHEPESRPASPVRAVRTGHRVSLVRVLLLFPALTLWHFVFTSVPLRLSLPSPPTSSHADCPHLESNLARAASPTVPRLLATVFTDPSFESTAVSALVAELVDFAAACRLDYADSIVAEFESDCLPSVGGECALGTDVLEDRQEEFQCFAAAFPPPGANIIDGMWIFRVKRPPGSPPVFKARYVARGFSQRQGVDFFQTFSSTPKMTTLRLRRPPGFTGSFSAGTQWSLWRPFYGLGQAPCVWHDTLRMTLAALGFAPSTADPSLFLRNDTSLLPFYVRMYVDDLVFSTADTKALALITRDRARQTITLTQSQVVHQVLQRFGFSYSSPQSTPLPTSHSLSAPPSDESVEPSGPYPELVGCLITSGMGLMLGGRGPVFLTGHADASWVDALATQRSSQGYTFSLGSGSISWRSTRSSSVLSSTCEAEIYTRAMAVNHSGGADLGVGCEECSRPATVGELVDGPGRPAQGPLQGRRLWEGANFG